MLKFILFLSLASLCFLGCDKKGTEPVPADGLKTISIGSSDRFVGDLNKIFPGNIVTKLNGVMVDQDSIKQSKLGKTQALIQFDEVKFMVFWWDFMSMAYNDEPSNACAEEMARAKALEGKNVLKSEDLLAGYSTSRYTPIASSGSLAKSGDSVQGSISIKPGINTVVIFFIKNGQVFWAETNLYLYISALIPEEEAGYFEDGWMTDYWFDEETSVYSDNNLAVDSAYAPHSWSYTYSDTAQYHFIMAWYPVWILTGSNSWELGAPADWIEKYSYVCNDPAL